MQLLGVFVNKKDFPKIHFYDQDFVDLYDKTWALIGDYWHQNANNKNSDGFFYTLMTMMLS